MRKQKYLFIIFIAVLYFLPLSKIIENDPRWLLFIMGVCMAGVIVTYKINEGSNNHTMNK